MASTYCPTENSRPNSMHDIKMIDSQITAEKPCLLLRGNANVIACRYSDGLIKSDEI